MRFFKEKPVVAWTVTGTILGLIFLSIQLTHHEGFLNVTFFNYLLYPLHLFIDLIIEFFYILFDLRIPIDLSEIGFDIWVRLVELFEVLYFAFLGFCVGWIMKKIKYK